MRSLLKELETEGAVVGNDGEQKLVIDNATHQGGQIEELVKAAGCEIWYLPPYLNTRK